MVGYRGRLNLDRLSHEHRNAYHKERMVLPLYMMVDTYIFVLKLGPRDLLFKDKCNLHYGVSRAGNEWVETKHIHMKNSEMQLPVTIFAIVWKKYIHVSYNTSYMFTL